MAITMRACPLCGRYNATSPAKISMPAPLYTAENCKTAYQLNWSLAIFWDHPPIAPEMWLPTLHEATEQDGIRILEHKLEGDVSRFLVSTRPECKPPDIARSIKGRLQYA